MSRPTLAATRNKNINTVKTILNSINQSNHQSFDQSIQASIQNQSINQSERLSTHLSRHSDMILYHSLPIAAAIIACLEALDRLPRHHVRRHWRWDWVQVETARWRWTEGIMHKLRSHSVLLQLLLLTRRHLVVQWASTVNVLPHRAVTHIRR